MRHRKPQYTLLDFNKSFANGDFPAIPPEFADRPFSINANSTNHSSRKRHRSELDDDLSNQDLFNENVHKRPKLITNEQESPNSFDSPAPTNQILSRVDLNDFDTNHKQRTFQKHEEEHHRKAAEQRKQKTIEQRKQNREQRFAKNRQKAQLYKPSFYNFDCNPTIPSNPPTNHMHHNRSNETIDSPQPSVDSDQSMNDLTNPIYSNSAYYLRSHSDSRIQAKSNGFIPNSCPPKHRFETKLKVNHNNEPMNGVQSTFDTKVESEEPLKAQSEPISLNDIESIHISNDREKNDENEDLQNYKTKQRLEREKETKQRAEKRLEELRNEQIQKQKDDEMRDKLRETIHPQILRSVHLVKHNPISLIKTFYPKTRISNNAKPKEVLKAFTRALAHFHPDRSIKKSIEEQVESEEIFKVLSAEKQELEAKYHKNPNGPLIYNQSQTNYYYYPPH